MAKNVFINFDHVDSAECRRAVRSRAAEHSHRVGPRKPKAVTDRPARRSVRRRSIKSCSIKACSDGSVSPIVEDEGCDDDSSTSTTSTSDSTDVDRSSNSQSEVSSDGCPTPSFPNPCQWLPSSMDTKDESESPSDVETPPTLLRDMSVSTTDTALYPVPALSWYPAMFEYAWDWMQRSWRLLDTTMQERRVALDWVQRVTMTEPCYFYINLLSVSGDLADRGFLDRHCELWLHGRVIASLNEALGDPFRAVSPGVILTVGRIAALEITMGNRTVGEDVHRPAQARLIAMAGGLESLGLPSLVHKHMLWQDRIMAAVTGKSMLGGDSGKWDDDLKVFEQYRPLRVRKEGQL